MAVVTLKELLEAGIHFGHQTRRWHPKMARFIFGQRNGIYIIDLQQTLRQLHKAYDLVCDAVGQGGGVLFVGTKRQAQEPVAREARRCGMYWVNSRWLGGTLTNWSTIRKTIRNLLDLEDMETSGRIEKLSKKEAIKLRKERIKLDKNLVGIKEMSQLPGVVFVVDARREAIAVREAQRLGIPCIAVVDTNCDPESVPLPIPGNDDAIRAINLFCKVIADAAIEGRMRAEKEHVEQEARKGRVKAAAPAHQAAPSEPAEGPETEATLAPLDTEEPIAEAEASVKAAE